MKIGKFGATAFIAIAAVGISAGTANAAPESASKDVTTAGNYQGIDYQSTLADSTKTVTTTVEEGRFEINGNTATLIADNGSAVTEVPLTFEVAGRSIPVDSQITEDGHSLALTPKVSGDDISELKDINSFENFQEQVNKNLLGMIAGGMIGGFIGGLLGFGIFSIVTGPLGLVGGALAGGAAQGGQPFIDALTALAQGQP
ncbi:hypothetical protein GCM10023318_12500 [Nocardia callitridis]|uniref:DUF8020 domain-containing protein n=2 Tax=Nocardia callitridis TaxID=648753 RepID=A0ABP9JX68_9NOCA